MKQCYSNGHVFNAFGARFEYLDKEAIIQKSTLADLLEILQQTL